MGWTVDDSTLGTWGSGAPFTLTHTCGANAKLLVVMLGVLGSTARAGSPLGVTYNGVAMTKGDTIYNAGAEMGTELWYLFDPGTGSAYTVSCTNTGTAKRMNAIAASFNGSGTPTLLSGSNLGKYAAPEANPSTSVGITTPVVGDLFVAVLGSGNSSAPSAQTGTLLETSTDSAARMSGQFYLAIAAESTVLSWTLGSDDYTNSVAAFKEPAAAGNPWNYYAQQGGM